MPAQVDLRRIIHVLGRGSSRAPLKKGLQRDREMYFGMSTLKSFKIDFYKGLGLETTTDLSPVKFWDGCTLSVVQNRVPLHMVRQWNLYNSPSTQRKSAKLYQPGFV
jgi:hypothetical protein